MKRLLVVLACVLFTTSVSAQTVTNADLPKWILDAIAKAEASTIHPPDDPNATGCPVGTSYIAIFTPSQGLRYECRDLITKDKLADRLTYLNSGLIVLDSTLTGYLVWSGIGKEANPFMVPFYTKDKPWRSGMKGVIGAAQTIAIYRLTPPKSKWRYASLGLAIAINSYACVNNYLIYRDHLKDK